MIVKTLEVPKGTDRKTRKKPICNRVHIGFSYRDKEQKKAEIKGFIASIHEQKRT